MEVDDLWEAKARELAKASARDVGVFNIDPDPPDLADRQADRVARHQQAEAARAGWDGRNWLWCGGCEVHKHACSIATCTGHRLCGWEYKP